MNEMSSSGERDHVEGSPKGELPQCCADCAHAQSRPGTLLDTEPVKHDQVGTFLVGCAFMASAAGGIGFLVAYWTGGSNWMLGGSLAVFLGGLGVMLVLWSHLLTLKHQVMMQREKLEPRPAERRAAAGDFNIGEQQIHRRGLLMWMAAGAGALFASIFVSWFRSLGTAPDAVLFSTVWKPGQRLMTQDGTAVSVNDLQPGNTVIVFPEDSIGSEHAQTVLLRVRPDLLQLPDNRGDWAPMGNLAFSRVCTHAGCAVGMYETTTHLLMCPCHQSTFDVLRGAQPTGGPAARPLPQLPLYADAQGILRAAGGFSEPPGPGFSGMPS